MTVQTLLAEAESYLTSRGVLESAASAEFLMASVLGVGRGALTVVRDHVLDGRQRERFREMLLQRGQRVPLAYVLGTQNFMGLDIYVTPQVLIPRPETEEVVSAALSIAKQMVGPSPLPFPAGEGQGEGAGIRILDICTGSGCIALALAREVPGAIVYGVDISPDALAIASKNAQRHGLDQRVQLIEADLFNLGAISQFKNNPKFDLIVSNPPYIPSARIQSLEPEVQKEPRLCLDGGPDGLRALRGIIDLAPQYLNAGGWLVLEIDEGQGGIISGWMRERGFDNIEVRRDLQGLERIALGTIIGDSYEIIEIVP